MSGDEKYNPLKDEIFLPVPLKIAQRKDLKNLSKLVYGYLLKCFGKDGLVCPTMAHIANDLKISRQMVSKCITELKTKKLIGVKKTGKASRYEFIDVNTVQTSDVNTVQTSDVNTVQTSPLLKEKEKKKIKEKSGAAPDYFNDLHPYLDEIMSAIPDIAKGQLSRPFVNKCLFEKNGDRPYIYWLFDKCQSKNDPAGWIAGGLIGNYGEYFK